MYIDNYEEALDSTDDVRRSLLAGLIDKRVNKYFSPGSAIVRKLEKDKYIVVFRYNFLEKLMQDRFSLLEEIKSIKIGNEMTLTLSMGIGTGSAEYSKNYDVAKAAMDLALGRGGDQAVVKDGEKILYYGGKSQQMEKNTRVKVRVKAHALRQILDNNSNVLVMGHTLADIDAFGSALGIYVIAKKLGKEAHIVLGEVTSSVRPFVNRFIDKEEYPDDMFIKPDDAPSKINASTVVIVVDVNRPQRTECPELLEKCKTVVVFDHHRRQSDTITGAVLSYVDPYASSASEMITEMIQYVDDNIKLKAFEADALYAGINKNTKQPLKAVSFLQMLYSEEVLSGKGIELEDKREASNIRFPQGVSIYKKELEKRMRSLSRQDQKQIKTIQEEVKTVRFYSVWDRELNSLLSKYEAQEDEKQKEHVFIKTIQKWKEKIQK